MAHEPFHRFERVAHDSLDNLSRTAALVVATLAVFLAIAMFLSSEAIKEAITGETRVADTSAVMEANEVKTIIAESNAQILRVVAVGSPLARAASAKAEALDARIVNELAPVNRKLADEIRLDQRERDHANDRHLVFGCQRSAFRSGSFWPASRSSPGDAGCLLAARSSVSPVWS